LASPSPRIYRALGSLFQLVSRDTLRDLGHETERLNSAAAETDTYIRIQLRAMNERLTRIENHAAEMRRRVEQSKSNPR